MAESTSPDRPSAGPVPQGSPPPTPPADAVGAPSGAPPTGHPPTGSPDDAPTGERASGEGAPSAWAGFADSASEADKAAAEAAAVVDADLASIASERDEFRSLAQRIQADFENYKKRVQKQQSELIERAAEGLVTKLLPVLDAAELAVAHGSDEVKQVLSVLNDVLGREGLEPISPSTGVAFDPNEHDAVLHEAGDGEPAIGEVMRAGYRWHGRVLRPAMVKVVG